MTSKQDLLEFWTKSKIITDKKLLSAFKKIPRENFIPESMKEEAYEDIPLPIGEGQTISQPTTVMLMTQALELKPGDKVLEVGAGSGYQAAIIAYIVGKKGKVITTEIIPALMEMVNKNLKKLGIKNVHIINTDGSLGYEKEAPYGRIIVTAASPAIPKPLEGQLKEGGIIVIPVGEFEQDMVKAIKKAGKLEKTSLGAFRFVPLKGKYGFS